MKKNSSNSPLRNQNWSLTIDDYNDDDVDNVDDDDYGDGGDDVIESIHVFEMLR